MNEDQKVRALSKTINELRDEFGNTVAVDEISDVVQSLMHSIQGDITAGDLRLYRELHDVLQYIQEARDDIASISGKPESGLNIIEATDELDAVVKATEEATGVFLDSAEKLESIADTVEGDLGNKLSAIATDIYQASNFQDITGQRINKVVSVLQKVEGRLGEMTKAVEETFDWGENGPTDEDLINGPAMPDTSNSQDDIGALLASFD